MSGWSTFPRLNELREIVNRRVNENYFSNADKVNSLDNELARNQFSDLEKELQFLDSEAWKMVKNKCGNLAIRRDEFRDYQFLFDQLNEIKGYLYLLEQGYSPVKFIPTRKDPTPDLIGYNKNGNAILEVKTINPSLEKILQLKKLIPRKNIDVPHIIPDVLMSRIVDAINHAKKQLLHYESENIQKRIVFLCINPELDPSINPDFIENLINQIQKLDFQDLEVIPQIV